MKAPPRSTSSALSPAATLDPESDLDLAVSGLPDQRIIPAMGRLLDETGRMTDILQIEDDPALVRYLRSKGELRRVG